MLGGGLATGQAEPLRWLSASLYFTALLAVFLHRSGWANLPTLAAAALLSALCVLVFCGVAAGFWPWVHALALGAANLGLLALMSQLFRVRRLVWPVLAVALLAGLLLPARAYLWPLDSPPAPQPRRALAVMTSLPLGPMRGRGISEILTEEASSDPVTAALTRHFEVRFIDFLSPATLPPGGGPLLLAHPRALQPVELVTLDSWVRAGGRAVVLADPLLAWPSDLPLGDPRRPPVTSLLDPLLTHWGLVLEPVEDARGIAHHRLPDGRLLTTADASRFRLMAPDCALDARGVLARCRLGPGEALLVADADLLNPALWMGGFGREAVARDRTADNMQLLARWLGIADRHLAPRTGWVQTGRDVAHGLAAALLPLLLLALWDGVGMPLGGRGKSRARRVRQVDSGRKREHRLNSQSHSPTRR